MRKSTFFTGCRDMRERDKEFNGDDSGIHSPYPQIQANPGTTAVRTAVTDIVTKGDEHEEEESDD